VSRTLLLPLVVALAACGGDGDRPAGPLEVVDRLRGGGYVVFLRHAATDHSQKDIPGVPLTNCAGQRNLTDAGRQQAEVIGGAWRALELPLGDVLSSGYCRTRETAELAFGRYEIVPALTGIPQERIGTYTGRVSALRRLLGTKPPDGENTVVVGHIANLEAATSVEIEEGESAIFEPLGDSRYRLVSKIPASAWPQLAGQNPTTIGSGRGRDARVRARLE
jgi:phosphohistidine phosphatase SixA